MKLRQLFAKISAFFEAWLPESLVRKFRTLDPKLVYGAASAALTYVVVQLLGLNLDDVLLTVGTVKVTWATAIASVAGATAAYYKANAGTILRTAHEDGNASPPEDVKLETIEDLA